MAPISHFYDISLNNILHMIVPESLRCLVFDKVQNLFTKASNQPVLLWHGMKKNIVFRVSSFLCQLAMIHCHTMRYSGATFPITQPWLSLQDHQPLHSLAKINSYDFYDCRFLFQTLLTWCFPCLSLLKDKTSDAAENSSLNSTH